VLKAQALATLKAQAAGNAAQSFHFLFVGNRVDASQ
jgi:hypothetical protein